jgi:plasmid stabilization system protein ParE
MMMVRFRARAQQDIASIYERIARDSGGAAERVEAAIRGAVDMLCERPELGVDMGHKGARRWPMPEYPYTIFYAIYWNDERIEVIRVVDAGRVRNVKRVPR